MRAWAVTRICSAERRHASLCDTSERHGGDVLILICLPVSRDCRDRSPWRSGEPIHFFSLGSLEAGSSFRSSEADGTT